MYSIKYAVLSRGPVHVCCVSNALHFCSCLSVLLLRAVVVSEVNEREGQQRMRFRHDTCLTRGSRRVRCRAWNARVELDCCGTALPKHMESPAPFAFTYLLTYLLHGAESFLRS